MPLITEKMVGYVFGLPQECVQNRATYTGKVFTVCHHFAPTEDAADEFGFGRRKPPPPSPSQKKNKSTKKKKKRNTGKKGPSGEGGRSEEQTQTPN